MKKLIMKIKKLIMKIKNDFSTYEKLWMIAMVILAIGAGLIWPEEDSNGWSGTLLNVMCIFITIVGLFCELLFSKQRRSAFLIYNSVEVVTVAYYLMTKTQYLSMFAALLYWIPAHTLGYFAWNEHKDRKNKEITVIRRLKKWQTAVILISTVAITIAGGFLLAKFGPETDYYEDNILEKIILYYNPSLVADVKEIVKTVFAYLDSSLFVMAIIDGILMFFRSRDSWWTWHIFTAVDTVVRILSGQWVLLVYDIGYFTNTTYGNIKWTQYIKKNEALEAPETSGTKNVSSGD